TGPACEVAPSTPGRSVPALPPAGGPYVPVTVQFAAGCRAVSITSSAPCCFASSVSSTGPPSAFVPSVSMCSPTGCRSLRDDRHVDPAETAGSAQAPEESARGGEQAAGGQADGQRPGGLPQRVGPAEQEAGEGEQ